MDSNNFLARKLHLPKNHNYNYVLNNLILDRAICSRHNQRAVRVQNRDRRHISPALHANYGDTSHIKRDVEALLECDAIYMLPGWKNSKGAVAEVAVADWLGLEKRYSTFYRL